MAQPATYTSAIAVTPNDVTVLQPTGALFVGGAGNLTVIMAGVGNLVVTLTGVLAGTLLPLAVKTVKATGTTCTNIVALR